MLLTTLIAFLSFAHATNQYQWGIFENNDGQWSEVIERDVCIVGGGASGVHAAVSLVDLNKTVVLEEHKNCLRGDTHIYIHPGTGGLVDIGVVIFQPLPLLFDFFGELDVPLLNMSSVTWNTPGQPGNTPQPAAMFATLRTEVEFRDEPEIIRLTVTDEEVTEAF